MDIQSMFRATRISGSGLAAEKTRMEVTANHIANAHTTGDASTGPYRRRQVIFSDALSDARARGNVDQTNMAGVVVSGITLDQSELPQVYDPGHPHADQRGFVTLPNISVPVEMVDMMTASRAYDANLKALQSFRRMVEQSLSLMRG